MYMYVRMFVYYIPYEVITYFKCNILQAHSLSSYNPSPFTACSKDHSVLCTCQKPVIVMVPVMALSAPPSTSRPSLT